MKGVPVSQPVSLSRRQSSTPAREGLPRVSISAAPPRQAFTSTPVADWDDEWRRQASCRDTDPALFFPVGSSGTALAEIDAAKAVCARCGVREACLDFAMQTNQEAGIWGGMSEDERRRLRRRWVAARRAKGATS
jgi:WhiB family redox-sensing transcriptional regulator